jgi:RNA polymerase sigma factor (TIGR02999 family)
MDVAPAPHEVTELLRAWGAGDQKALTRLTPLVHEELRRLAHRYMARERPGHTLQTTALVNEAYLRLVGVHGVTWQNRAHFFALCAGMMRRILTDFARARNYQKRGGGQAPLALEESRLGTGPRGSADLLALDDALKGLQKLDPRKSQVVELRFFGGLSAEETAEVLKVSPETVLRDWRTAKAWLYRELGGDHHHAA